MLSVPSRHGRWSLARIARDGCQNGAPIGKNFIIAVAWCVVIALVGYFWALAAYNRDPVRV
jgi:hypothetical protein